MAGEQLPQAREAAVFLKVGSRVVEGAWHVLNVDRIAARGRLIPESAERFEIALERHQVEASPEFERRLLELRKRRLPFAAFERTEIRDEIIEAAVVDLDVRIAEKRREIVGVGAHPRILKIDDIQAAFVEHQVAAVIVAVAQHARLRSELVRDCRPLPGERLSLSGRQADSAIGLDKMADEKVKLPRKLLDIERDAVRQVTIRRRGRAVCG